MRHRYMLLLLPVFALVAWAQSITTAGTTSTVGTSTTLAPPHSLLTYSGPRCNWDGSGFCGDWVYSDPPAIGPNPGDKAVDPETGHTIMRVTASGFQGRPATDHFGELPSGGWGQMFNADETKMLFVGTGMRVYCVGLIPDNESTPDTNELGIDLTACNTGTADHALPVGYNNVEAKFHSTDPCVVVMPGGKKVVTWNVCTGAAGPDLLDVTGNAYWPQGQGLRNTQENHGTVCGVEGPQDVGYHVTCRYKGGPVHVLDLRAQTVDGSAVTVLAGWNGSMRSLDITSIAAGIHAADLTHDGRYAMFSYDGNGIRTLLGDTNACKGGDCSWGWDLSTNTVYVVAGIQGGGHGATGVAGLGRNSALYTPDRRYVDYYPLQGLGLSDQVDWNAGFPYDIMSGPSALQGEDHASWVNNYPDAGADRYPYFMNLHQGAHPTHPNTKAWHNEVIAIAPPADGVETHGTIYRLGQHWTGVSEFACNNNGNGKTFTVHVSPTGKYMWYGTTYSPNALNGGPGNCTWWGNSGVTLTGNRVDVFLWQLHYTGRPQWLPAGCPAGSVVLQPGDNIQSFIDRHSAGTNYCLIGGTYRHQSIVPKAGDGIYGQLVGTQRRAILSGARQLTAFKTETVDTVTYYVATGQTQESATVGTCQTGYPRCNRNEDFFFDGVALIPVDSLANVTSGKFYFDYAADKIYFIDDPVGHTVEASVTANAISGTASNVTLKNLIVEKYANPAGTQAAIRAASGWTLENVEARLNHGAGLYLGESATVTESYLHNNGQLGLYSAGAGNSVEDSEISANNTLSFDWGWEAGGGKITGSEDFVARNNWIHDNQGPGLWFASANADSIVEENRTYNNKAAGVLYEANNTGTGTIRYNTSINDGVADGVNTTCWYGAGIVVSNSSPVNVYNNTVLDGMNGICAINADGSPYIRNLSVHDNWIRQLLHTAAGIVTETDAGVWTDTNLFNNNTYATPELTSTWYEWDGSKTKAQWQAAGQDAGGTWMDSDDPNVSTAFAPGNPVLTAAATEVYDIPSTSGTLIDTETVPTVGTITRVAGPIWSGGAWWWQAQWPDGDVGWSVESDLMQNEFSVVFVPDQHPKADGTPWTTNSAYIVNKRQEWNTQAVVFTGDIRMSGEGWAGFWTHGWQAICGAMRCMATPGNHDCDNEGGNCQTRDTGLFDTNIGYSRISDKPYGPVQAFSGLGGDVGHWTDTAHGSNANHAIRFTYNGHKFLGIGLEMFPRTTGAPPTDAMAWASALADVDPTEQVIWATHGYLISAPRPCISTDTYCANPGVAPYDFPTTGQQLWDQLIKTKANSLLTFSGHFLGSIHEAVLTSTGTNGNPVHQVYANYQSAPPYPNDAIVRVVFRESPRSIDIRVMKAGDDTIYKSWTGLTWP